MNRSAQYLTRSVLALGLAVTVMTGRADAQTKVTPGWNMFSPQQDAEIGAQSAAEAERQLPILRDPVVQSYVDRIGQKLAANAGGPQFQYRFRIVNASDINAFALPGGYVYLNRGILENARNEGEVAGVVAHEIAHVALRHGTHQASKAYTAQAGLQVLGGLLGGRVGANTAQVLNVVGGVGLNALFLKFSRELETQADVRGSQLLAASGYTPADMVSFFRQLESAETSAKTTWLSNHPSPPDRIARIEQERALLREPATPTLNTRQLASIQNALRRHGTAPTMAQIAQGTSPGGSSSPPMTSSSGIGRIEAPSSSWRTFTNSSRVYAVSYPANWRVYDSTGFGVTIAPEGALENVGGRSEMVIGLIVNHYDPNADVPRANLREGTRRNRGRGRVTLQSATDDLISQIQHASPHLRVMSGAGQELQLDGRRALAASLRGSNPNTRLTERVTVVTRALPDRHLIYMVFVTPEDETRNYNGVLNRIVQSLDVADSSHQ